MAENEVKDEELAENETPEVSFAYWNCVDWTGIETYSFIYDP